MRNQGITRCKPGTNRSVHLFVASLLWTVIGTILIVRGWWWIGPDAARWYVLLALAVGTTKSLLVLDNMARHNVQRIVEFADGTCLGAVYSWKTWLFVGLMMATGIIARTVTEPGVLLGTLYVAIGWALILSSRHSWIQWTKWIWRR